MKAIEVITGLRTELGKLGANGQTTIQIANLDEVLKSLEVAAASNDSTAPEQLAREEWKLKAPLLHASSLEQYKSVLESGQTALKTLTTINGGAAVALLAFIGNMLTKGQPNGGPNPVPTLNQAMLIFILGVFLTGVSSAARYLTQLLASRSSKASMFLLYFSISSGIASLGAFLWGGIKAFLAF
jgi:hypothetical protein